MSRVLVWAELDGAELARSTWAAVACARRVVELFGGSYDLLLVGAEPRAVEQAARAGAQRVLVVEGPSASDVPAERLVPTVCAAASDASLIVGTATSVGRDLLPRVAARLGVGYASDCAAVAREGDQLAFKRPLYAGNAWGYCTFSSARAVVSVRQSEWAPATPVESRSEVASLSLAAPSAGAERVEVLGFERVVSARPRLNDARVVVAGGRALRDRFDTLIGDLADALGAGVGATRAACDAGYAPGDLQVGQTGKVVAPDLYIAVGISGAIQHVAGMKGSKVIVAINKDQDAPIFQIADYGLVADCLEAVPELTAMLRAARRS